MANVNAPRGLELRGKVSGAASDIQMQACVHAASDNTALFQGDLVALSNTTDSTTGLPIVTQASNASTPFGVVISVNPINGVDIGSENLNRVYCPASTRMQLMVCTDPNALYEIQSTGTVLSADMGKYADISTAVSGSTITGISGMQLDQTSVNASPANLQLFIYSTIQEPDNAVTAANTRLLVKLVNSALQP